MSMALAQHRPVAHGDAERIARLAVGALRLELDTYPKPGLVSLVDSGSHDDMDASTFEASAAALEPYFAALAHAGAEGRGMTTLRLIGLDAERAMLAATGGINTHRGAIFGLGLLVAAAGALGGLAHRVSPGALGAHVRANHARGILEGPMRPHAPGARARTRYRVGGAPMEAALGFPTLYRVGVPSLHRAGAIAAGEAARVEACFALIAQVQDTNLLHRGGEDGLRFAQAAAAGFVARGGVACHDWRSEAERVHRAFVARRLSPGGAADLLAMSLFVDAVEGPRG